MKLENVKSIILTFLVGFSIILTWNLWTFQPKDEFVDTKLVHEISIADQEEISQIIKPNMVLYHTGDSTYGTTRDEHVNKILTEVGAWNFYDLGVATILNHERIQELLNSDERIVLYYPDEVPFDLYKGVFQIKGDDLPQATFDRVVIHLESNTQEGSTVYFVSTTDSVAYESHVNPERMTTFFNEVNRDKEQYDPYEAMELPDNHSLYVPTGKALVARYKYYLETIDPDRFKAALFRDPNKVRKDDTIMNGEQYTDDLSMMNVDHLSSTLFYVNPGQELSSNHDLDSGEVLRKSIDFINEHGGWTDDYYRYFSMSVYEQKTVFRLYKNGLPVFNEQGMAEIRQNWGAEEIYKYRRPYISIKINFEQSNIELPPGDEAFKRLMNQEDFNPRLLQDMKIGYRLSKDPLNSRVIILDPQWYYLYAGSWLQLDLDEEEGDEDGLE